MSPIDDDLVLHPAPPRDPSVPGPVAPKWANVLMLLLYAAVFAIIITACIDTTW
jgi:hypothetical protein